ncbi:MAG: hypothetical protein EXR77_03650 [Myxococcales bacterium]|nr:hypothetical protein [Myxococcales bacterium]
MLRRIALLSCLFSLLVAVPAAADIAPRVLGLDLGVNVPVGKLANSTGMQYFGLVRYEHTLQPQFALTVRAGYLAGSEKDFTAGGITTKIGIDVKALWAGLVYRTTGTAAGVFATAEVGPTLATGHVNGAAATGTSDIKPGGSIGIGWRSGPLSVRGAVLALDIGDSANTSGTMLSVGWDFKAL